MVKKGAALWAACLVAAWVGPLLAETNAAVPLDLVLGILGADGEDLFVGGMPDDLSRLVPVPDDAVALGGIQRKESASIVLAVPDAADDAHALYAAVAATQGWARLAPAASSMGFVKSDADEEKFYCGPGDSLLSVHVTPAGESASRVTLTIYPPNGFGPCGSKQGPPVTSAELAMPILRVPQGVQWGSSTTCSTAADSAGEVVRLTGSVRISDMVSHFGAQLEGQGWLLEDQAVGQGVGLQAWSRLDETGHPWKGTLSVLSVGSDVSGADVLEASFQIVEGMGQ